MIAFVGIKNIISQFLCLLVFLITICRWIATVAFFCKSVILNNFFLITFFKYSSLGFRFYRKIMAAYGKARESPITTNVGFGNEIKAACTCIFVHHDTTLRVGANLLATNAEHLKTVCALSIRYYIYDSMLYPKHQLNV